jgi:hypothetical protein
MTLAGARQEAECSTARTGKSSRQYYMDLASRATASATGGGGDRGGDGRGGDNRGGSLAPYTARRISWSVGCVMDMHVQGYEQACEGRAIARGMTVCTTTMGGEPLAAAALERVLCACVLSLQKRGTRRKLGTAGGEGGMGMAVGEATADEAAAADLSAEGMARIGVLLLKSVREESAFWLLRAITTHTLALPLRTHAASRSDTTTSSADGGGTVATTGTSTSVMHQHLFQRLFSRLVLAHVPQVHILFRDEDDDDGGDDTASSTGVVQSGSVSVHRCAAY